MARIKLLDAEPLELEFKGGTVKRAKFTMRTLMLYHDHYGDEDLSEETISQMVDLPEEEAVEKADDISAKMLHCGFMSAGETVTLVECENLLASDSGDLIRLEMTRLIEGTLLENQAEDTKKKWEQERDRMQESVLRKIMHRHGLI